MTHVHVVLPNDIDDPAAPSGGNGYDRRVCAGLTARGWTVREHAVPGRWPEPTAADRAGLTRTLAGLPDGAVVLVDGLVGCAVPDVLAPESGRLRLVVLVHMPLDDARERAALAVASAVVTTSGWTRQRLLDRYGLPAGRVHAAPPGADPAALVPGSTGGGALLCVAALAPHKGQDVLVDALARLTDRAFGCDCVGTLDRDPGFVARLRERIGSAGLGDRIRLTGPYPAAELDAAYRRTDLLVLPSHGETYGMVLTEALARGIPVVASNVGGVPEALGPQRPGLLVPSGDPGALAGALGRWLDDVGLRERLRAAARGRRTTLAGWDATAARIADVLAGVPA